MARSNKYASLNFNDIYEKKSSNPNTNNKQQSSSSINNNKTIISNSRIHGNMLVLTRPTPKSIISSPSPSPSPPSSKPADSISLRPLGHTGPTLTSPILSSKDNKDFDLDSSVSPKPTTPTTNRFVPPHLRPGFVGKEETPQQPGGVKHVNRQGNFVSPSPYNSGDVARPKSGGGYERMRRGVEVDPVIVNRPGSSGARLNFSG